MRKGIVIIGIMFIFFIIGLCGCEEQEEPIEQELKINYFTVTPSYIQLGETANLSWNVDGAAIVSISQSIGNVALVGNHNISPTETTTYTLTAINSTASINATTTIIVNIDEENGDINNPELQNAISNTDYPVALLNTTKGLIAAELYDDKAPITCQNFIKLVNDGFYDGMIFHRIMDDFMIQAGSTFPDGTTKQSPYGYISFEGPAQGNNVSHIDGTISMASTGSEVGGSAQFFIMDGDYPSLDGHYAAFGRVIYGIEVVRDIADEPEDGSYGAVGGGRPTNGDIIINSIKMVKN